MAAKKTKLYLRPSEAAALFDVAPTTISKWIDKGLLPGYRMPGDKKNRRILRVKLIEWLKARPDYQHILEKLNGESGSDDHPASGCQADQGEAGDDGGAGTAATRPDPRADHNSGGVRAYDNIDGFAKRIGEIFNEFA